jgi:hypothetical protein
MSDIRLTCDETPLAWPSNVGVDDLTKCGSCGFRLLTSQPGSLQVLTRRQGGAGDGVNIEEDPALGVDYRGQRYTYEEAVLHVPGLHVFPGQKEAYPAEYHLHFKTFSAPQRAITIVVPVSHRVSGPGEAYFAAAAAKPDPNATRPTVDTLFVPGSKVIQYRGPDIRGRTKDTPQTDACSAEEERQFLMVLTVARIRATDLERIPREGSLSTDPRDLPAPGVKSKTTLPRDRMLRCSVLADPGILGAPTPSVSGAAPTVSGPATKELECNPVKVVGGRDVVVMGKKQVPLTKVLGQQAELGANNKDLAATAADEQNKVQTYTEMAVSILSMLAGLYIADTICQKFFWDNCFTSKDWRLTAMENIKKIIYAGIIASTAAGSYGVSSGFFSDVIKKIIG